MLIPSNLKIRTNLGFVVASILILLIGTASHRSIQETRESSGWVSHTLEVRGEIVELYSALMGAQNHLRGHLITGQSYYESHYHKMVAKIHGKLHELKRKTSDNPEQLRRIDALSDLLQKRIDRWEFNLRLAKKGGKEEVRKQVMGTVGKELDVQIRSLLDEMVVEEDSLWRQRIEASRISSLRTEALVVIGSGAAILLLLAAAWLLNHDLRLRRRIEKDLLVAKRQAEKDKQFSDSITQVVPNSITIFDLGNKTCVYQNTNAERFGVPFMQVADLEDPILDKIVHPDDREMLIEQGKRLKAMKPGEIAETVYRMRRADGDWRWILARQAVFKRDESGVPSQIIAITQDITDLKLKESEIIEVNRKLIAASKLKSEFLANMSHEIRTPLNGIIGMTDLLMDTQLDEQQRKYARIVQDSGNGLLAIVNDILDFSKIEAGKIEIEVTDFSPRNLIEGQAELLLSKAREKGLSLMTFIDPELPPMLKGDPGRLGQVLINLIGNAIKFTAHGSVVVRARSEKAIGADVHLVRFSIEDTGIGLSEGARKKLFHPFTQADGSTARKYGGTGLGLSISKRFVELMDGEIGIDSVEGQGSVFWFTLPLKRSAVSDVEERRALDFENLRVLVVDDDPPAGEIMSRYLDSWAMSSHLTKDGEEALAELRRAANSGSPYQIALLDWRMPGMSGGELARKIREDSLISGTRLILCTAFDRVMWSDDTHQGGFSGYLSKPIKQSELYDCLVDAIHGPREERVAAPHPTSQETPVPSEQKRILVVEDNSVNQMLALAMLKKLGYSARAVANGIEAVEAVKSAPFDLVLMDCQMPEMDGFEATHAIRRWENSTSRPRLPIVALTANAMKEDEQRCLMSGMDSYLSKPIKMDKLDAVLRVYLRAKASDAA